MHIGKRGSPSPPSYGSDGAIEREIARAMNVDVIVLPALDLGRNEIARDAKEDGDERYIIEQGLLRLAQQDLASGGIAFMVGAIDQRFELRTVVLAVVQIGRGLLTEHQIVFG